MQLKNKKNAICIGLVIVNLLMSARASSEVEVGAKRAVDSSIGDGEHFLHSYGDVAHIKTPRLVTRLKKGDATYEMTYSGSRVYRITRLIAKERQLVIEFRSNVVSDQYLMDLVYINEDTLAIAFWLEPYTYEVRFFKKIGNAYADRMFSWIVYPPGFDSADARNKIPKPNHVNLDEKGNLVTSFQNGGKTVYSFYVNSRQVRVNGDISNKYQARWFDEQGKLIEATVDSLPERRGKD